MTYLEFHLYLIGPAVLLGGLGWMGLEWQRPTPPRPDSLSEPAALALLSGIAFGYTLPWDHLLIKWAVWSYDTERIATTLWGVPVEECAFFVLQPLLAGSWYAVVVRLWGSGRSGVEGRLRSTKGGVLGGIVTVVGSGLSATEGAFYLGMILLWSGPVLALQWGLRGALFWRRRRTIALGVGAASLFLWIADRIAIGVEIWRISARYTLGLSPFGLPLEEALFFFVTNLLVVQGLVMLADSGAE